MRIAAPNYTQTPNTFFDDIAKTLKEGELRVLLVIMRQTFGWRKEWDYISISQLMRKTGMERMAVLRSLKGLIEKKIVIKRKLGPKGIEKCWYSLNAETPEKDEINPDDGRESPEELEYFSNNSDQYPKDTPTSILKIPKKETKTKEKKTPQPPKGGGEVPLKERTRKKMPNVSAQDFERAWKEYELAPAGQVKSIKEWLTAVIQRQRHEMEEEKKTNERVVRHKIQARREELINQDARKKTPWAGIPCVCACRECVEFAVGNAYKSVKYTVSDQEWEKETGWKALNEGDI